MRALVEKQCARATQWLTELKPALLEGAHVLMEKEVITGEELKAILEKHRPTPLQDVAPGASAGRP